MLYARDACKERLRGSDGKSSFPPHPSFPPLVVGWTSGRNHHFICILALAQGEGSRGARLGTTVNPSSLLRHSGIPWWDLPVGTEVISFPFGFSPLSSGLSCTAGIIKGPFVGSPCLVHTARQVISHIALPLGIQGRSPKKDKMTDPSRSTGSSSLSLSTETNSGENFVAALRAGALPSSASSDSSGPRYGLRALPPSSAFTAGGFGDCDTRFVVADCHQLPRANAEAPL